jgi:hypothetical protein
VAKLRSAQYPIRQTGRRVQGHLEAQSYLAEELARLAYLALGPHGLHCNHDSPQPITCRLGAAESSHETSTVLEASPHPAFLRVWGVCTTTRVCLAVPRHDYLGADEAGRCTQKTTVFADISARRSDLEFRWAVSHDSPQTAGLPGHSHRLLHMLVDNGRPPDICSWLYVSLLQARGLDDGSDTDCVHWLSYLSIGRHPKRGRPTHKRYIDGTRIESINGTPKQHVGPFLLPLRSLSHLRELMTDTGLTGCSSTLSSARFFTW